MDYNLTFNYQKLMEKSGTREPQYNIIFQIAEKHNITKFGLMANASWNQDPKRMLFTLARYKFVAKMIEGKDRVLEIGCADAFGTRIVQQHVEKVTALDFDPIFIEDAKARYDPEWPAEYLVHDMLVAPPPGTYDAAFCLDVLEHIDPKDEDLFLENVKQYITENTVFIAGMPSLESQPFASPQSKAGHINCI